MSGLIGTAKEKIWDIVSEFSQSNNIDTLKMGMIFYRDRGDIFVTKKIALTIELDEVYSDLLEIIADGGGDSPESVNQALFESVNDINWSKNTETYKTIFVVGDCPPHMDYKDDVKYTESCKVAVKKGIVINTIKLGNSCKEAIIHFKKMSEYTNGKFLKLDQNAKDYTIETPYDDEINKVSIEIDNSRMYYGTEKEREINYIKKNKSIEVYEKSSKTANSSRANYKMSKAGKKGAFGSKELINDFKEGKININEIEENELPEELKGKNSADKNLIIKNIIRKRDSNYLILRELLKKKRDYIKQKESLKKDSTSFSKEVIRIMKKQSKKN